eukprot:6467115-Lingulodinium_polyedra.AAC.1
MGGGKGVKGGGARAKRQKTVSNEDVEPAQQFAKHANPERKQYGAFDPNSPKNHVRSEQKPEPEWVRGHNIHEKRAGAV